jgi:riboflavin kinase/FMN adenylyltransferase
VSEGNLPLAASLLGRPFTISGLVQRGRGLGKTLGFPTANILIPEGLVCPAYGVYATRTTVNGRTYESITNIGVRPTVDSGLKIPLIEPFLYDANLSLYDQPISVHFLERTRQEVKFDSVMEMSERIHQDLYEVRTWHR